MDLRNKKILVVGFGRSGRAVLRFLLERGACPAVTDLKKDGELEKAAEEFRGAPVDWYLGSQEWPLFESADAVVVSPGVPWNTESLRKAREKGIPVLGEMELAFREINALPDSRRPVVVAVTGTNGKTTTVSLIHHLLTTAGKTSLAAGNIGRPLCGCLAEIRPSSFLVLEASSYQIQGAPSLKADVSIWLNATEDHLDWHASFADYIAAKVRLIRQTRSGGKVFYNADDSTVAQSVEQIPCDRRMFSTKRRVPVGGWMENGRLMIREKPGEEPAAFSLERAALKGIHNWENMLAALLAVFPFVGESEVLQTGLESFKPLPHRMETVRELDGVIYVNDSKATNVGATLKAFQGIEGPVVWIAGGRGKGGNYSPLKYFASQKVRKALLIGEDRETIKKSLEGVCTVELFATLQEAVREARASAKPGDVVLFSPACASFDMFRDYVQRGEAFAELVRKL